MGEHTGRMLANHYEERNPPSAPAAGAKGGGGREGGPECRRPPTELVFTPPHPTPGAGRCPGSCHAPAAGSGKPFPRLTGFSSVSELLIAVTSPRGCRAPGSPEAQDRQDRQGECDQMRSDAERDAQRIRSNAVAEAELIVERAKTDARKIRAEAQAAASMLHTGRAHGAAGPCSSQALAKADRCLAFMDKLVGLHFLSATQQVALGSEDSVEITLEDAEIMLRRSGFSEDDCRDVLELLINDESTQRSACPGEQAPSEQMEGENKDENPSEDSPSTPGKRPGAGDVPAGETSPNRIARLQAAIRKHPILNWLKKHDPKTDEPWAHTASSPDLALVRSGSGS